MALIECAECGLKISQSAAFCPSCGAPKELALGSVKDAPTTSYRPMVGAVAVVAGIAFAGWVLSPQKATKPPPTEQQIEEELQFREDVRLIKRLRESMKNPDSFKIVEVLKVEGGVLCVTYRATNGFGGTITESQAISRDARVIDWHKHCARRTGTDLTYIRNAL